MTEKRKKRESVCICIAVVATYIMMYVMTLLYQNAILGGLHFANIFKMNVESLVIALILAIIPYERLSYVWSHDALGYWFDIKTKNNKRNMLIEAIVLYGILLYFCIGAKASIYPRDYRNLKMIALILTLLMAWIIINSFKLIKNNIRLFIIGLFLIMANGTAVYSLTDSFYNATLTTLAIFICWNVFNFMSDRNMRYKAFSLIASIICAGELFNIGVDLTDRYNLLSAWLNPTEESNLAYSWEYLALNNHSLNMPSDLPLHKQIFYPFLSINNYVGIAALLLMFLAFVIITIAFIRSRKILSKNRFSIAICIYTIFAVLYIYTLLADLGFVPTAGYALYVSAKSGIVAIVIVIRLFIQTKVPIKTIEAYDDYKHENYEDCECILFNSIKEIENIQRKITEHMTKHLALHEHKLNLINDNLDKIYEKIGTEKIKENDDGYEKEVKKYQRETIQSVAELQEEILKLYRERGYEIEETMNDK